MSATDEANHAVDILNRIEAGEGRAIECARGLGDGAKVRKAMCAFANAAGGLIVLGVNDQQRIVGVREDAEKVQERLTQFLHAGISNAGDRLPSARQCSTATPNASPGFAKTNGAFVRTSKPH